MEHNKAPGPDGFPPEFYQVFWDLVKDDVMDMFTEFHVGKLSLNSLNFGTIILLSKNKDVKMIQQYRPTCVECLFQDLYQSSNK
jgi:mannosylglycoprotein endo-beta-mannosidase